MESQHNQLNYAILSIRLEKYNNFCSCYGNKEGEEVLEDLFEEIQKHLKSKEVKELRFEVSMDDFGAGYSSLNSLKELPLDVLKLDAEFFRGEEDKERGNLVVGETVSLAQKLDMRIVAEGIETREQVDFLAEKNCDLIQGYYFAKPMSVEEFEKLVYGEE